MKIKKILIVPAENLVEKEPALRPVASLYMKMKSLKRKIFGASVIYNSEIQRYGDIPSILGPDNVFTLGNMYSHFHSSLIPAFCPYPSCHNTPRGIPISEKEIKSIIKDVQAVLISVKAGWHGEAAMRAAKNGNVPVALIDAYDHQSNYGAADIRKGLCRGFREKEHFDLYFKNDLPLGYKTNEILPLAPCPVRPEVYNFQALEKNIPVFFSGRARLRCQPDGNEAVNCIRSNFNNALILEYEGREGFIALRNYWDYLSRARAALSPSRLIWDSFRHCEAGLAPETAVILPRPYVETVGPALQDGINAIFYETELQNGRYHLKNTSEFIEKVRFYLAHPEEMKRIASRWNRDVKSGHTILARSRYILETIEKIL